MKQQIEREREEGKRIIDALSEEKEQLYVSEHV